MRKKANKHNQVADMLNVLKLATISAAMLLMSFPAYAQEVSREQIKGLDEQVQEIKTDILGIAAELNQLEEKLLYPSNTQLAVFISLAHSEKFRLDAVEIQLAGKPVAHHLYTFKEVEALQKGGVQRIYTGNIRTGEHELQVAFLGKSEGGADIRRTDSFRIEKGVGPRIVEITLADSKATLKDR
jgi:hypothetical protein